MCPRWIMWHMHVHLSCLPTQSPSAATLLARNVNQLAQHRQQRLWQAMAGQGQSTGSVEAFSMAAQMWQSRMLHHCRVDRWGSGA